MAAVSPLLAPNASTPPSSSHGGQNPWKPSAPNQHEIASQREYSDVPPTRAPLTANPNGPTLNYQSWRPDTSKRGDSFGTAPSDPGYLAPARALARKESNISDNGSANDSLLDLYSTGKPGVNGMDPADKAIGRNLDGDDDDLGWIHRDKLARIESQELQAAGIILPRTRPTSKSSRRERSRDQVDNGHSNEGQQKQRLEESPAEEEETGDHENWDLRRPEEAAEDQRNGFRDISGGMKGVSRIPVSKTSPLPIPMDYLERDTPVPRKPSNGWTGEDESITYPRARHRSLSMKEDFPATPTPAKRLASDNSTSPTKKNIALRKPAAIPSQRPKTRSGPKDTQVQRPTTRSGEPTSSLSASKRPEGDPPWLASMYKPDPRLPPDQQLLPTVAKRLQQEQWEKEGRFGTTYDTKFRPLSGQFDQNTCYRKEELPQTKDTNQENVAPDLSSKETEDNWPLKIPTTPTLNEYGSSTATAQEKGGYSTMPKVLSSAPIDRSPKLAPASKAMHNSGSQNMIEADQRDEDAKTKRLCGCCLVM